MYKCINMYIFYLYDLHDDIIYGDMTYHNNNDDNNTDNNNNNNNYYCYYYSSCISSSCLKE